MKTLELEIENYNNTPSKEYIIGDYSIEEESLQELSKLLGIDCEEEGTDEALDWWLENADETDRKVIAREFYNQTISRKDISVDYRAVLKATFKDAEVIAYIDYQGDEFYNNQEAKEAVEEDK